MSILAYALLSLQEAKDALKIVGSSEDTAVTNAVNAATEAIEGYTQNGFVQRAYDEFYTGGVNSRRGRAKKIFLRYYPIVSVASITDDAATTVSVDDFTIWPKEGFLEHVYHWPVPMKERGGTGRWRIVYTAGRFANTAAVAADLKEAAVRLLRYWRARKTPGVESKKVGDFETRWATASAGAGGFGSAALPDDVTILLQRYISRTGG